jgi:hypothetical protein
MSSVVISGDTSGAITLAAPAVSGTNTATLPAATGTVMVSGNMPAFRAYSNSNQSISSSTFTKVVFGAETFDTNNNFASSTFTPTVAGYYQINAATELSAASFATYTEVAIYKNGSIYSYNQYNTAGYAAVWNTVTSNISDLVYCNGTTDYIEIYTSISATTPTIYSGSYKTWVSGSMVRAA